MEHETTIWGDCGTAPRGQAKSLLNLKAFCTLLYKSVVES